MDETSLKDAALIECGEIRRGLSRLAVHTVNLMKNNAQIPDIFNKLDAIENQIVEISDKLQGFSENKN